MRFPFLVPAPSSRPFDVVGLGLNSIDLVAVVERFPASNTKQRLRHFARQPGGQMATATAACARLGWKARYVGAFGDDELGRLARENLEWRGVDLAGAWTTAGATNQFAVVLVDEPTGERTVLWDRHPGLAIAPSAVPREVIQSARVLMVDCHETAAAARAAEYGREAGMVTIVDVEKVRTGIQDLLRHIDAVIAAESFPTEYTGYGEQGRALAALAAEFHAPLVVVTLGDEGSLAMAGGREIRTPGFQVDCLDTTGAGDAFRGGFAAACLRAPDGDLEDALRYANAVAALNCEGLGAQGGLPTSAGVEALLSGRRGV